MKNFFLSLVICVSVIFTAQAQQYNTTAVNNSQTLAMVNNNEPVATKKAELASREVQFPGGMAALQKFVTLNNKYYELAKKNNLEGKVMMRFTINPDGSLSNIRVLESSNEMLNEYAVNIIKTMPSWIPAVSEGACTTRMVMLPIEFQLF